MGEEEKVNELPEGSDHIVRPIRFTGPVQAFLADQIHKNNRQHFYHFFFGVFLPLIDAWRKGRILGRGQARYSLYTCGPMDPFLEILPLDLDLLPLVEDEQLSLLNPAIPLPSFEMNFSKGYATVPLLQMRDFLAQQANFPFTPNSSEEVCFRDILVVGRCEEKVRWPYRLPGGAERRRISNIAELAEVLTQEYGDRVRYVEFENLHPKEQIKAAAAAKVMVAQHGAGLSNMFWMQGGSQVFDIQANTREDIYFGNLAEKLGHELSLVYQEGFLGPVDPDSVLRVLQLRFGMTKRLRVGYPPKKDKVGCRGFAAKAERPIVQTTSFGGCGTLLIRSFLRAEGVPTLPWHAARDWQYLRRPPLSSRQGDRFSPRIHKAIYLFGDPREAILTVFNSASQAAHIERMTCQDSPWPTEWRADASQPTWTLASYLKLGQDLYRMSEHLDNWLYSPAEYRDYPILLLRYETLWECLPQLFDYLEIPKHRMAVFPPKNAFKTRLEKAPSSIRQLLDTVYGSLTQRIETLPDIAWAPLNCGWSTPEIRRVSQP